MTFRSRSLRRAGCCVIILLVLAKWLALAADPHPSLPPPVIPECLGVNIHFTDPQPGEMEMLAAAGFKWVRMDFTWASTEREKGVYDFGAYDRLVAHLDKHKLRALFILDYGNKLYDPDGSSPHTDESRAAFAKWAAAVVAHFKGKGYLWELWNEPNIAQFWKPKPNVDDYVTLAKATASALREAGLIAGRDGSPSRPPDAAAANESSKNKPATDGSASRPYHECLIGPAVSTIDLTFLEACFKAGLLDVWDAVSVHPYRQSAPETVEEEYRSVRLLIRKYAPKDKTIPVICSEWGYSSAWKDFDEEKQAKYLPRQFLTNIANDVALSIWYDWHDDGPDPKEPEHHFGLVRHEYREGKDPVFEPKPAYQAAKTLMGQLVGMRFNKRLYFASPNDYLLFFTKAAELRAVTWTTRPAKAGTGFPFEPSDFHSINVFGKAEPMELVETDYDRRKSFAPSQRVQYLTAVKPLPLLQVAAAWERVPLEFAFAASPEITITTSVSNPTERPFRFHLETHELFVGGSRDATPWIGVEKQTVLANRTVLGKAFASTYELNPGWMDVELHFEFDADTGAIMTQRASIALETQISAEILPPTEQTLAVVFQNRWGSPFLGVANLQGEVHGTLQLPRTAEIPVEFAAGEHSRTIEFKSSDILPASGLVPFSNWHSILLFLKSSKGDWSLQVSNCFQSLREKWTADALSVIADGDPKVTAKWELSDGHDSRRPPAAHSRAVELKYSFQSGWKFLQAKPEASLAVSDDVAKPIRPQKFAFWLHGDAKSCQARIRFTDATGQTFQPDGPKIDWTGWRYVTFPMQSTEEKPLAHWGGADDGVIHYPIKWDTIFLLDNVSRQPVEGEVYLSAPTLIY